ncbi:MAG: hypothetical protein Q8R72_17190 [Hylemonella sp.]|nr:hypothetical protein [Hylemonella sp.]
MNRRNFRSAALVFCFLSGPAQAASFDCARASTKVEKLICSDAELSQLDDAMGPGFAAARERASDAAALRRDQKQWLTERNRCTDRECVLALYVTRLWQLAAPDPVHPVGGTTPAFPPPQPSAQAKPPAQTGRSKPQPQPAKKAVAPEWPRDKPDPEGYAKDVRVLETLKALFLAHLDRAGKASIPYVAGEFPWRINWDKQQAYCRDIWSAFTSERQKRLRFFENPTASVNRDGAQAFEKAWRNAKFEQGCRDEFPYGRGHVNHYDAGGRQFYDRSPDWVLVINPWFSSLSTGAEYLGGGALTYAHEPDAAGNRCPTTSVDVAGYQAGRLEAQYRYGGMESIFVLVDDKPLILKFGVYVPRWDRSAIEEDTFEGGRGEQDASYYAWFGKRRGRTGQGYVAFESHQTNLYRSLALEPSGYEESYGGVVSNHQHLDKRVGGMYSPFVDFHRFTCIVNFDIRSRR